MEGTSPSQAIRIVETGNKCHDGKCELSSTHSEAEVMAILNVGSDLAVTRRRNPSTCCRRNQATFVPVTTQKLPHVFVFRRSQGQNRATDSLVSHDLLLQPAKYVGEIGLSVISLNFDAGSEKDTVRSNELRKKEGDSVDFGRLLQQADCSGAPLGRKRHTRKIPAVHVD